MAWSDWFGKKPEEVPNPEEVLKPGSCECTHNRCTHINGKGRCQAGFPPDEETKEWTSCACQIYIRDDDDDGDDDTPESPVDPEVAELEKMLKR